MESIIFRYINKNGDILTAIGSHKFYKNKAKTCKQVIAILGFSHTEEVWGCLVEKTESELLETLEAMLWENSLFVEHLS